MRKLGGIQMLVIEKEGNYENINIEASKALEEYLQILKLINISEATIKNYKRCLERFLRDCNCPLESLNKEVVLQWITETSNGKKDSTRRFYISILSSFFKFCWQEGYTKNQIVRGLRGPTLPQTLPKYLMEEEIAKVRVVLEEQLIRDQALFMLLLTSGLRRKEICNLLIEDINLEKQRVRVREMDRRQRERYVYFSKECELILQEYLNTRSTAPTEPLFVNRYGRKLQPDSISLFTRRLGEKAGLKQSLHPNIIRNTFAKLMLERGMSLSFLAEILGHESYNTTLRYVRIISEDKKKSALGY